MSSPFLSFTEFKISLQTILSAPKNFLGLNVQILYGRSVFQMILSLQAAQPVLFPVVFRAWISLISVIFSFTIKTFFSITSCTMSTYLKTNTETHCALASYIYGIWNIKLSFPNLPVDIKNGNCSNYLLMVSLSLWFLLVKFLHSVFLVLLLTFQDKLTFITYSGPEPEQI